MNLRFVAFFVCLLTMAGIVGCECAAEPRPAGTSADLGAKFDALVPTLLARTTVPGVQMAVIDQGAVAWHGSYGFADLQRSRHVTDRTLFNIGSVSKATETTCSSSS